MKKARNLIERKHVIEKVISHKQMVVLDKT